MGKSKDAFRTISEVAEWLDTQAHVLRFWESKFSQVKPVKRAGGRRYYRPTDMKLLGGIKKLLHDEGMTIKGAQKLLREKGIKHVAALSQPLEEELTDEIEATPVKADTTEPQPAEVVSLKPAKRAPVAEASTPEPVEAEEAPDQAPAEIAAPDEEPLPGLDEMPAFVQRQTPEPESSEDAEDPAALAASAKEDDKAPVTAAPEPQQSKKPSMEPGKTLLNSIAQLKEIAPDQVDSVREQLDKLEALCSRMVENESA